MPLRAALLAPLLSLAIALPAPAQERPAFSSDAIRADVTFLADDLLEGRDGGTRGYDIAARYVAARFTALGLEQIVPGSWYQPVTLAVATLEKDSPARLTIGGRAFDNGGDVVIGAFGREPKQGLEAGAVFVGYGLQSAREKIDDYAGLDLRGKWAVALSGSPVGMPSEIGAHLAAEKAQAAQKAGAIGLVTIPSAAMLARMPWERLRERAGDPSVGWMQPDGQLYVRTPGIRGSAYAHGAAAEALLAGSGRTLAAIRAEAGKKGGRPKGFALKPMIRLDRTSSVAIAPSSNVLAVLPGSDPALAGEYVLLMAHLDHVGVKPDTPGKDKIHNGAMDNASGVATMMAVAKAFAESGTRLKRPILFAAVTAEEDGLLGSQYLAKNPVLPEGGKLVGVVNLDMPILTYDFQDVVAFGAEHSTLGPIVEKAAKSEGVVLSPDPLPAEGLFTRSDHYRFVEEGVPSVFLMTGFAGPGKAAFEHFLKTDYHKPSDQIDLPFHWEAAAKFARVNYAIAREIADAAEAPRWYEGDFFGDAFAPGQAKAKP
ncbi:M20/M25/M40 family metallo-hydrolase [Sphingobium cloacae]|uniref:Peptidase M28 n=1 Tax=Sphingobium cloacae TaxID=120107 RepID=A0A1E1F5E3_9SPHN|nr:M20/M25/M40 family metallo-hydrolase [Sphingobium cloacae]BAV65724.1 peptidase M28 [Sphingobium cloacae]